MHAYPFMGLHIRMRIRLVIRLAIRLAMQAADQLARLRGRSEGVWGEAEAWAVEELRRLRSCYPGHFADE